MVSEYYSEINSLNHITLFIQGMSHILKNENYELCFSAGSFVDQITTGKIGTVIWLLVGMFGGSMSLDCFGGFLDQIMTGKKVQSSGHWLQWRIVLAGLLLCFLAGSLIKLQITTGKKRYSRLAIGWKVTSKTCLTMVELFAGPNSMAMGNQPMPLRYPLCKRLSEGGVRGFLLTL